MDYYCITPLEYYRLTGMANRHLVIAPYLRDNPDVLEFYRLLITKGADVILDNGVYETGKPMELDDYIKVIRKLKPTQVVAPDAWGDFQRTITLMDEFYGRVEDEGFENKFQIMGVPHGKTIEEWMKCYYDIIPMCDVIGLSVGEWGDTTGVVRHFFARYLDERFSHVPLHLLGLWDANEISKYTSDKRVRSVDTSMPWKLAKRDKGFFNTKSDFTKMDFNDIWTDKQIELAICNLDELKEWIENG